jgi:hypothetical protein
MSSYAVPPEIAVLLGQFKERTELRDPAGKLIGVFTPQVETEAARGERFNAPFDLEEAERIWEEERHLPGYTLEEIWRELKGAKRAPE